MLECLYPWRSNVDNNYDHDQDQGDKHLFPQVQQLLLGPNWPQGRGTNWRKNFSLLGWAERLHSLRWYSTGDDAFSNCSDLTPFFWQNFSSLAFGRCSRKTTKQTIFYLMDLNLSMFKICWTKAIPCSHGLWSRVPIKTPLFILGQPRANWATGWALQSLRRMWANCSLAVCRAGLCTWFLLGKHRRQIDRDEDFRCHWGLWRR